MVRDPGDLYEVSPDAPELDGGVMLHYLDGFIDAGAAGKLLTTHLMGTLSHERVATFDVDRLIDYRSRRPVMTFSKDHWSAYTAPELAVHLVRDAAGTQFLLLTGPEPDHEWELFVAAVDRLATRLGVDLAVGFHGIPMGVPHTRPLGITAHGSRAGLIAGYRPVVDELQVPGSAPALLEFRLGEQGRGTAGFTVHVPHYLSQAAYPAAAITLLEAVSRATGLSLPDGELREASARTDEEIARQVEASDEITEVVQALERQYDAFADAAQREGLLAEAADMPTADELAAQFERFLAEQGRPDSPET
ncbi:MAG: proteasome assembly chaperone family protein [Gemmatimonadota bacterium]